AAAMGQQPRADWHHPALRIGVTSITRGEGWTSRLKPRIAMRYFSIPPSMVDGIGTCSVKNHRTANSIFVRRQNNMPAMATLAYERSAQIVRARHLLSCDVICDGELAHTKGAAFGGRAMLVPPKRKTASRGGLSNSTGVLKLYRCASLSLSPPSEQTHSTEAAGKKRQCSWKRSL